MEQSLILGNFKEVRRRTGQVMTPQIERNQFQNKEEDVDMKDVRKN